MCCLASFVARLHWRWCLASAFSVRLGGVLGSLDSGTVVFCVCYCSGCGCCTFAVADVPCAVL